MAVSTFMQQVLNDIEKYEGVRRPLKSSFFDRMFKKKLPVSELHPNPDDEFSQLGVGPSMEIIEKYKSLVRELQAKGGTIYDEPIIVEKMHPEGYMLLNGHHRWAAAVQSGVDKVHVDIVNMTREEDLNRMISGSDNDKQVVFDLDEVVFASAYSDNAEAVPLKLETDTYTERLRRGVPEVMRQFANHGYDVWVYTASYHSEDYIREMLRAYGTELTGIVNGMNDKMPKSERDAMRILFKKYERTVHVDQFTMTVTDRVLKGFDEVVLGVYWEESILDAIKAGRV